MSTKHFMLVFGILYISLSILEVLFGADPKGCITTSFFYAILGGLNVIFDFSWLRAFLWSIFMGFPVGLIYLLVISDPGWFTYLVAHSPIFAEIIFLFYDQIKNRRTIVWVQVLASGIVWFSYTFMLYMIVPRIYPSHYYPIMFTMIVCSTVVNSLFWRHSLLSKLTPIRTTF